MGILNVTPDSFYDGGRHGSVQAAIDHGLAMADAGADIIDIGGESTRPGGIPVPWEQEWRRIEPVVAALTSAGLRISLDTRHARTMAAAAAQGVPILNDVTALEFEAESLPVAAASGASVVLMHGGAPTGDEGGDIVSRVIGYLERRVEACVAAGISRERIAVDPGFGFAKTIAENFELLERLAEFKVLGLPVLVGLSRKFGKGKRPAERLAESLDQAARAVRAGAAILRVHDVRETAEYLGLRP